MQPAICRYQFVVCASFGNSTICIPLSTPITAGTKAAKKTNAFSGVLLNALLFFIFKTPYPFRKKCQDSRQYESFHSSIL